MIEPSARLLGAYAGLGLLVALLRLEGARRVPGMATILPVVAAGAVSAIAFAVSGRDERLPPQELIPPLVVFLPGALPDDGHGRLCLGRGCHRRESVSRGHAPARAAGVRHRRGRNARRRGDASPAPASSELLGGGHPRSASWYSPSGRRCNTRHRPARCLGCSSYSTPRLAVSPGQLLFGAQLSEFVGGLVVAPFSAILIERFQSAPPALVKLLSFLRLWLLVPGALGLIGFDQLVGNEPVVGTTSFVDALISIISIALGNTHRSAG